MRKERFSQIIDEVYEKYTTEWMKENPPFAGPYTDPCLTQDEFINNCKTDPEFSEKWGLKIEERDLTMREQEMLGHNYGHLTWEEQANFRFEPTKLITLTYNNETIESYE